jgi:hypothetical protein
MTKKLVLAAFAALTLAAPALADRDMHDWKAPINGSVSAIIMQDGDVMMKVRVPATVFGTISRDMKNNKEFCEVQGIYTGAKDTMILVCHPAAN